MVTNDLVVLMDSTSKNGFALAVVAVAPGESPWRYLYEWYVHQGFKHPEQAVQKYEWVTRKEGGAVGDSGVIVVAEWYDGVLSTGPAKRRASKYDTGVDAWRP